MKRCKPIEYLEQIAAKLITVMLILLYEGVVIFLTPAIKIQSRQVAVMDHEAKTAFHEYFNDSFQENHAGIT